MSSCFIALAYSQTNQTEGLNKERSNFFLDKASVFKQFAPHHHIYLDSAIVYDPNNPKLHFGISLPHKKNGRFIKTFYSLNKAVYFDTKNHFGYLGYRAWSKLYYLRDYEGAIADIHKLDALTPNFVDYPWGENMYYLLGLSYMGLEKFELAITAFNKAEQLDHDFYSLHYQSICEYKLGRINKAIITLDQSLEKYDGFPDSFYYKALYNKEMGKDKLVVENLLIAKKLFEKGHAYVLNFVQPFFTVYEYEIEQLLQKSK